MSIGSSHLQNLKNSLKDVTTLPLIMGVLNVTPDSFSDGGKFVDVRSALAAARAMVNSGADLIDIGGESTRPGSSPIDADEQIRRIVPAIRAIRSELPITISIDTTRAAVAAAALDAGADIVNDISAGRDDPALLPLVAQKHVPIILMHMQGTPATMQHNPRYHDVVTDVRNFLFDRLSYAKITGIDPADVLLDPGIGFGKTVQHNLELLNRLKQFTDLGCPLVVGSSRKGFIGTVTGEGIETGRPFGTAATVAWAAMNGAAIVRVHDVDAMAKVTKMIRTIRNFSTDGRTANPAV